MEQSEQISAIETRKGLWIRELARRPGVHRRAVRQALESAVPPPKSKPKNHPAPKLDPHKPTIDGWLRKDQEAPRKQRHTVRAITQTSPESRFRRTKPRPG